ncbi:MAG: PAS domain-containing sensor histidine kinase [Leptospiraceae bacterium]|nr:PAS domain-containing sensor histidine kinase [Leptospiraceae bacterium]MDW8307587.1 PAS domain-containing sensor histidine kinase [Leptospiraceae bacterium]
MSQSLLEKARDLISLESYAEFASLFEAYNRSAIVSETDRWGRIVYVNKLFEEVSGYKKEEVLGKDHRILNSGFHPKSFFRDMWKTINSGKSWRGEIRNRAKDGSYYWVDTFIHPLFDTEGTIRGYLSLRYLITEKKRAEQARDRYYNYLIRRNATLENFSRMISHNLRSPLTHILGLVEIFENKESLSPKNQEYLRLIKEAAQNIDRMVHDIYEILKTWRFHDGEHYKEISIREVWQEVLAHLLPEKNQYQAEIKLEDFLEKITTIPLYFKNILYNLLSNAIKYGKEMNSAKVVVRMRKMGGNYMITVADYGQGIEKKHLPHMFELYRRFQPQTMGQGVGLYLVKSQVEALGGNIRVKSKPGEGTVFTVFLPIIPPSCLF